MSLGCCLRHCAELVQSLDVREGEVPCPSQPLPPVAAGRAVPEIIRAGDLLPLSCRVGPVPNLGNTIELALVASRWASWP